MTYRAGVGPGLARALGITGASAEPTLTCDVVGCGTRMVVQPVRGCMPAWLANKKAPKGWRRFDRGERPARHMCPRCVDAVTRGKAPSQTGDQNAPDTAEPAEKQPDSR